MTFDQHVNLASGVVSTAPNTPAAGTGMVVTLDPGVTLPTAPFSVVVSASGVTPTAAEAEIIRVPTASGGTWSNMARAQEGTSARTILVGDQVYIGGVTAKTLTDIESAITAETSRATTAEGLLATASALAAEATSRANGDAAVAAASDPSGSAATALTTAKAYTDTETTRATGAEGTLTTAVAAKAASSALTAEVTRATTAEGLLAPLASPALTGNPTVPTQTAGNNSTRAASTAYADGAVATEASARSTADALLAPKASPALTGTPTVPTATPLTSTTQAASTAYADAAVAVEKARALAAEAAGVTATVQTASYTLALVDAQTVVEMNNASAVNVTVPPNSSVAFPVGTVVELAQYGAGQVTVVAGAGVTIRTPSSLTSRAQYSTLGLRKRATDEWVLSGDVT